jgi:predicted nucleotidyltransferase
MDLKELQQYRLKINELAKQYHSHNVRVFGYVGKNENTENSDIDFLIDPDPEQDLFDVIRLRGSLRELLNYEVDIVLSPALHYTVRQEILTSAILL